MADERADPVERALEDGEAGNQVNGGQEEAPLPIPAPIHNEIALMADVEENQVERPAADRQEEVEQAANRDAIEREHRAREDEEFARMFRHIREERRRHIQEERDLEQREEEIARRMRQREEDVIWNELGRLRERRDRQVHHIRAILREAERENNGAENERQVGVEAQPEGQRNEGNDVIPMEVEGGPARAVVARPDFAQRARDRLARQEQRIAERNRRNELDRLHRMWELEDEQGRRRLREEERRAALREWRIRRRDEEGEGRDDEPREAEGREAEEADELFAVADGEPVRMRWPWARNLRWEDEDESDSDGEISDGMVDEAKTLREKDDGDPSCSRYTRACLICVTENPRQRAVFTQCGHIVCFSCAVDNARSNATKGKCVFCQKKSSFVKLFEDLVSTEKSEMKSD